MRGLRAGAAGLAVAAVALAGCSGPDASAAAAPPPTSAPPPSAPAPSVVCGGPGAVSVGSAKQLTAALAAATPGAVIVLAPGTYTGSFTARSSGTADRPSTLCGPREAVLDGGGSKSGYALHLDGASYWQLSGFTLSGGQKGLVIDDGQHDLVAGLLIQNTGDEALHLRQASSDNLVSGNEIRGTGLRSAKFGEGIYVGSAKSNWCEQSGCGPDRSDRNVIENNTVSATTAESVDIKEGTTGGVLRGNSFSGAGSKSADSWVDVKGNGWTITGNRGVTARKDGYQVHQVVTGWGLDNTFTANTSDVGGTGYAVNVVNNRDRNRVACSNTVTRAGKGLSNIPCTP